MNTGELFYIKELLAIQAKLGAKAYADLVAPKSGEITQNQAYREFGEVWVNSLLKRGLLEKHRKGKNPNSRIYYKRLDLVAFQDAETVIEHGIFEDELNALKRNNNNN
jgi:hypothetical protein